MSAYCTACGEPLPPTWICLVCEYEEQTGHRFERTPKRPVFENAELLHLFELSPPKPRAQVRELYENAARGGRAA